MRVVAKCRICGAGVKFFGDVCASHKATDEDIEGLLAIVAADTAALAAKAAEGDY